MKPGPSSVTRSGLQTPYRKARGRESQQRRAEFRPEILPQEWTTSGWDQTHEVDRSVLQAAPKLSGDGG